MDAPRLPPPRQSTNNAANRAPTPPRDITPPPPGPSSSIYSSNILITTSPHPNTREAQLQIHQAASHPIFPEDGKPLEPPPPYSMGSAASNTLHTPSLNANSPPSYSQSFAIQRQSPTSSQANEEKRKSFIKECPPEAFKLNMESHIATVYAEHEARQKRRNELNDAIAALESQRGQRGLFHLEEFVNKMETNYLRMKRAEKTIDLQHLFETK